MAEWQPIETAPRKGKPLLLCNKNQGNVMAVAWWSVHQYWKYTGGGVFWQPTHWMPLPEPPK